MHWVLNVANGGCKVDGVARTRDGAPRNCRVVDNGRATVKEEKREEESS
jgi:hypothetical protein